MPSVSQEEALKTLRVEALEICNRLLSFVEEQKIKFRCMLAPQSNLYQWHLMVKYFLAIQKKRTQGHSCRHYTFSVAATFNRGQTTSCNIISWERLWVERREISESLYGRWHPE